MSLAINVFCGVALLAAIALLIRYEIQTRRRWNATPSPVEIDKAHVIEIDEIRRLVHARDGEPTAAEVARELNRLRGKLRESAAWLAASANVIEQLDAGADIDGELRATRDFVAELFEIAGPAPAVHVPPAPRRVA